MEDSSINKNTYKKYLPAGFLILITIALMFYFKENKGSFGEIVEQGKADLVSLYTDNLQPFLFGSDLNNEDVFNFALYQTLPIDKNERDVLRINNIDSGRTYYQVLPKTYKENTKNYENFTRYMAFSEDEKAELDSILESYKPELAEAILTDDNNTIAVSRRAAGLQKAILTDIAAFSRNADKDRLSDLFGKEFAMLDSKRAIDLVNEIKKDTSREYLVLANDTAFASRIEFDTKEFAETFARVNSKSGEFAEMNNKINIKVSPSQLPPPPPKIQNPLDTGFSYSYSLPEFRFSETEFNKAEIDSLNFALSQLENSLRNISINLDSLGTRMKLDFQRDGGMGENVSFELNLEGLGEIINKSIKGAMTHPQDAEYWEKFGREVDSIAENMVWTDEDSLKKMKEKLNEIKSKHKKNN